MKQDTCIIVNDEKTSIITLNDNKENKIITAENKFNCTIAFLDLCHKYGLNINSDSSALDLLDEMYLKFSNNELLNFMDEVEKNSLELFGERK